MRMVDVCDSLNPPILVHFVYTFDSHKLIPLQFELLQGRRQNNQSVFTNNVQLLHVAWFRSGSATPTQVISADLELGSYATFVQDNSPKEVVPSKIRRPRNHKISMMYTNSEALGTRVSEISLYNCTIRN
ncbi:Hypothetical_protein [Hexamita inflata]|uniref:Hypothetical_protein n=1 Tax=Hexamita inflata TaxID=28002 RepID=A0AA86N4E6_9EUKA|nr:Hypothetical protein HINF_LOCUS140 [Hexamita inflata]